MPLFRQADGRLWVLRRFVNIAQRAINASGGKHHDITSNFINMLIPATNWKERTLFYYTRRHFDPDRRISA